MDCEFCNRKREEIIGESENLYITPSLGQIVEGYTLICTKKHILSFSQLPEQFYAELERLKEKVKRMLSEIYCSPLFFEHGAVSEKEHGSCCINHAHLHCVPFNLDIFEEIIRHSKLIPKQIIDILELKNQHKEYFYYENQQGKKWMFELNQRFPRQYLRQIISVKAGVPEKWDWRIFPEHKRFSSTKEKLSEKWQRE